MKEHSTLFNVLLVAFALSPASRSPAAPEDNDASFGGNGSGISTVGIQAGGSAPSGADMAVDGKGRIVVASTVLNAAGNLDLFVIRYTPDGLVDGSFGTGGQVTLDFSPNPGAPISESSAGLAVDSSDNIYIAGNAELVGSGSRDILLVKLLGDGPNAGGFDTSFNTSGSGLVVASNNGGPLDDVARSVAIHPDGSIVVGGSTDTNPTAPGAGSVINLSKITPAGTFDPAFNGGRTLYVAQGGLVTNEFLTGMAIDSAGNIYFSHNSVLNSNNVCGVGRVTSAGAVDATYGTAGFGDPIDDELAGTSPSSRSLVLTSDGKALICGSEEFALPAPNTKFFIAQYSSDGTTHDFVTPTSFGSTTERAVDIAIDSLGRIVVGANSSGGPGMAIIRYSADGALDPAFNSFTDNVTGAAEEELVSIAIQADGKVLSMGNAQNLQWINRIIGVAAQPDNRIGARRNIPTGDNRYNTSGAGQRANFVSPGARPVSAFLGVQNDGEATDGHTLGATRSNRIFRVVYLHLSGPRRNVTAAVVAGRHAASRQGVSRIHRYQARVVPVRAQLRISGSTSVRRRVSNFVVRSASTVDPAMRDAAVLSVRTR